MDRRAPYGWIFAVLVSLAPLPALAAGVQALFDLGARARSPFPSDFYSVPDESHMTGLRVSLPVPDECGATPALSVCGDVATLNTLDGFSLQPRISIPFSGPIDVSTVTSDTVFLLGPGARRIGIEKVVWDVQSNTLHVEPEEFLEQHARYVLIVTRAVRDAVNEPLEANGAFQAFRHGKKLGHADDHGYREVLLGGLELAAAAGVDLNKVAVASVFTTQSITAILEKIRDQIKATHPEPADFGLGPAGSRTVATVDSIRRISYRRQLGTNLFSTNEITPQVRQLMALQNNANFGKVVSHVAYGRYRSPQYLTACTGPTPQLPCDLAIPPVGTRTGTPLVQRVEDVYFNLFLPVATAQRPRPAAGWPVVIHNMGLADSKELGSFLLAPAMAAHGTALIGVNGVGQGFGPLSTLTLHVDLDGNGSVDSVTTFSAGARGFDQNGDGLIGTGTIPTNEGNDTLPQGPFIKRRDHYRQTVADLMQLVRIIEVGIDVDGDGLADLDRSRIYFTGASAGANHGTAFLAVEPGLRGGVLTATGGAAIDQIRLSSLNRPFAGRYLERRAPSLINAGGVARLDGVPIAAPRFNENLPLRGRTPLEVEVEGDTEAVRIQSPVINTVRGAMEIQQVLDRTRWSVQANDPLAYAGYLRKEPLNGLPKSLILQFAIGDQNIPNPSLTAVLRAGDLAQRATYFRNDLARAENPSAWSKNPHEFGTRLTLPVTAEETAAVLQVQRQIAMFFASDGAETIDPDGPCPGTGAGCFFETPIQGPLPEELNYIP